MQFKGFISRPLMTEPGNEKMLLVQNQLQFYSWQNKPCQ